MSSGIKIARIYQPKDDVTDKAIQEVATEFQNQLQYGTDAPDGNTEAKGVYFQIGTADANGWAEVSKIYIQTKK